MTPSSRGTLKSCPWSAEEDQLLYEWQGVVGNKWSLVAQHIPGRTGQQCAQRWRHKVNPDIVHAPWTDEEDGLLRSLVDELGQHWAAIARRIPGRTDQQCLGRWRRRLDPAICRGEWTREEDELLLNLHAQLGNSWSQICRTVTGRTSQQCRGRFFQLCAKEDTPRARRPPSAKTSFRATRLPHPSPGAPQHPHARHARRRVKATSTLDDQESVQGSGPEDYDDNNDTDAENHDPQLPRHPVAYKDQHKAGGRAALAEDAGSGLQQSDSKPLRCSESPVGSGGSECAGEEILEDGDENTGRAVPFAARASPEHSSCGAARHGSKRPLVGSTGGSQATSLPTEGGGQTKMTATTEFAANRQAGASNSMVRRGGSYRSSYRETLSERSERTHLPCGPPVPVYAATPCNMQPHRPAYDHWSMGPPLSVPAYNATVVKATHGPGDEAPATATTDLGCHSNSVIRPPASSRQKTPSVRRPRCTALLFRSLTRRLPMFAGMPGAQTSHGLTQDDEEEYQEEGQEEEPEDDGGSDVPLDTTTKLAHASSAGVRPGAGYAACGVVPMLSLQQLSSCPMPMANGTPASGHALLAGNVTGMMASEGVPFPLSAKRKMAEGFALTPAANLPGTLLQARWSGSADTPCTPRPQIPGVLPCLDSMASGTKARAPGSAPTAPIAILGCGLAAADWPPLCQGDHSPAMGHEGLDGLHSDPATAAMLTQPSGHTTPDSIVRMLHSPPAPCDLQNTMTCAAGDSFLGITRQLLGPTTFTGIGRPASAPALALPAAASAAATPEAATTPGKPGAAGLSTCAWVLETPAAAHFASPPAAGKTVPSIPDAACAAGGDQAVAAGQGGVQGIVASPQQQSASQWSTVPALSWTSFQQARHKLKELQQSIAQGGLQWTGGGPSQEPTPVSNHTCSRLDGGAEEVEQAEQVTPVDGGRTASGRRTAGRGSRCNSPLVLQAAVDLQTAFAAQQGADAGAEAWAPAVTSLPSSLDAYRGGYQPASQRVRLYADAGTSETEACSGSAASKAPAAENASPGPEAPRRVQRGFDIGSTGAGAAADADAPASWAPGSLAPPLMLVDWPQSGPATTNYLAGPGARAKNKHQGSPSKKLRVSAEALYTSNPGSENEHPNIGRPRSVGASPSDAAKSGALTAAAGKHLRTCSLGMPGAVASGGGTGPASPVLPRTRSLEVAAPVVEQPVAAGAVAHGPLLQGARRACVPGYPGYGSTAQCQSLLAGFQRGSCDRQEHPLPSNPTAKPAVRFAAPQPLTALPTGNWASVTDAQLQFPVPTNIGSGLDAQAGGQELSPNPAFLSPRPRTRHQGVSALDLFSPGAAVRGEVPRMRRHSDGRGLPAASTHPAPWVAAGVSVSQPVSSTASPTEHTMSAAPHARPLLPLQAALQNRAARHSGTAALCSIPMLPGSAVRAAPAPAAILQLASQAPVVAPVASSPPAASVDASDATVHYPTRLIWGLDRLRSGGVLPAISSLSQFLLPSARQPPPAAAPVAAPAPPTNMAEQTGSPQPAASRTPAGLCRLPPPTQPATQHADPSAGEPAAHAFQLPVPSLLPTYPALGVVDANTLVSSLPAAADPAVMLDHGSRGGAGDSLLGWLDAQPLGFITRHSTDMDLGSFDMGPMEVSFQDHQSMLLLDSNTMDISAPLSSKLEAAVQAAELGASGSAAAVVTVPLAELQPTALMGGPAV